jgi:hypothetical protein
MIAKIRNLDPTGVEVEAEEFILPLVVEYTLEEGYKTVIQPDGTVITYEPARQSRYFLDIGEFIYRLNARTGELTFICKTDQV